MISLDIASTVHAFERCLYFDDYERIGAMIPGPTILRHWRPRSFKAFVIIVM